MSTIFDQSSDRTRGRPLPSARRPERGRLTTFSPPRCVRTRAAADPEQERAGARTPLHAPLEDELRGRRRPLPPGKLHHEVQPQDMRGPGPASRRSPASTPSPTRATPRARYDFSHEMSERLCGIAGLAAVTLQPAAGAHGELTGMFLVKRHFEERKEPMRTRILLPDSAHGTNPASATLAGFTVTELASGKDGLVDLEALDASLDETVAAIMLTVPNTLGLFESRILDVTERVHSAGALCLLRRGEPERLPRAGAAGRHGGRPLPLQPAQDLLHAPRGRRPGRGPPRRLGGARRLPSRPAGRPRPGGVPPRLGRSPLDRLGPLLLRELLGRPQGLRLPPPPRRRGPARGE